MLLYRLKSAAIATAYSYLRVFKKTLTNGSNFK